MKVQGDTNKQLASVTLVFLSQAQVRLVSPDLENAMAVRAWLNQIANGDLKVVRSADLAPVQSDQPAAPADV